MHDEGRPPGEDRGRQGESATAAERAARRQRERDRERASVEPFDYPYPERRAGVRARRHVSGAEAAADMPPGIPGGYGTTGGGQSGATGTAHPPAPTPRDVRSRKGSAEPGGDDEGPVHRSGR
ncbi:hypothetical protein ABB07_35625 [Streptomyces incarnatus]|uniref:Uncharacterized protein n=2 Tax=Streptomyces incarnatus TaxID=665007 RepID=A0ABM5TWC9_9ACTN|nr:hypothetical protein ABB07_35625 [Streptomyces incarnatus]